MFRKRMITLAMSVILSMAAAAAAYAQEPSKPAFEAFPQAIGVFVISPPIMEVGLQYQRWAGPLGFQTMGGIYYNPLLGYTGKTFDYWIEAEGLYRVYGERFADWLSGQLYLWMRAGHEGYIEATYSYPIDPVTGKESTTPTITSSPYVPAIIGGLGIGVEIILFEHFSIPFEFGYEGSLPFGYGQPIIGLSASAGLRYRF